MHQLSSCRLNVRAAAADGSTRCCAFRGDCPPLACCQPSPPPDPRRSSFDQLKTARSRGQELELAVAELREQQVLEFEAWAAAQGLLQPASPSYAHQVRSRTGVATHGRSRALAATTAASRAKVLGERYLLSTSSPLYVCVARRVRRSRRTTRSAAPLLLPLTAWTRPRRLTWRSGSAWWPRTPTAAPTTAPSRGPWARAAGGTELEQRQHLID